MNVLEMIKFKRNFGNFDIIVTDTEEIEKKFGDELYATENMIGEVVDVIESSDKYIILINWNKYEKHNEKFESHDWYCDRDNELGTMKEAGFFPKNGIEHYVVYKGLEIEDLPFKPMVNEKKIKIFHEYENDENFNGPFYEFFIKRCENG